MSIRWLKAAFLPGGLACAARDPGAAAPFQDTAPAPDVCHARP